MIYVGCFSLLVDRLKNESNESTEVFPKNLCLLPEVNFPFDGCKGYLFQGEFQQIVFMCFEKRVEVPLHSHEQQWEIVLEGEIDLWMDGVKKRYGRGDRFFIPSGVMHKAIVYPGYASCVWFNQKDRYKTKL